MIKNNHDEKGKPRLFELWNQIINGSDEENKKKVEEEER